MIKKCLDKYISWAAEDGGYNHLKYTPNITAEIIDKSAQEFDLTGIIEARMRHLARSHRGPLALEQAQRESTADADIDAQVEMQIRRELEAAHEQQLHNNNDRNRSWRTFGSRMMSKLFTLLRSRPIVKPESHGQTPVNDSGDDPAEDQVRIKTEEEEEVKPIIKEEEIADSDYDDDDVAMTDIPLALETLSSSPPLPPSHSPSPPPTLRPPPVIYGFFVVNTTVLLLTADTAKDEPTMNLSFHLDMDFQDRGQSVWNALTVAIVACLARDNMMTRMGDFEEEGVVEESDPDA